MGNHRAAEFWKRPEHRASALRGMRLARASIEPGEGFLYVAELVGAGAVKIGFSLNPRARVAGLCSRKAREHFKLLAFVPATLELEQELHRRLVARRHPKFAERREFYPFDVLTSRMLPAALRQLVKARAMCRRKYGRHRRGGELR